MHEIPQHIIDRLRLLSPDVDETQTRKIIKALYRQPHDDWQPGKHIERITDWLPLCVTFNIPRVTTWQWYAIAQTGLDVSPHIDHYLNMIGVTLDLITQHNSKTLAN